MPVRLVPQRAWRGDRGFALLIVLWVLVLIAFTVRHQRETVTRIARGDDWVPPIPDLYVGGGQ